MNEKEQYWIEKLGTFEPNGFNMTNGGDNYTAISDSLSQKLKDSWTEDRRAERGKRNKEYWNSLSKEEQKEFGQKISDAFTDKRKEKMSKYKKEFWENLSDEKRQAMREKHIANHHDCSGDKNSRAKTIRCIETGEVFTTVKAAAEYFGINYTSLKQHTRGEISHVKGYHFEVLQKKQAS